MCKNMHLYEYIERLHYSYSGCYLFINGTDCNAESQIAAPRSDWGCFNVFTALWHHYGIRNKCLQVFFALQSVLLIKYSSVTVMKEKLSKLKKVYGFKTIKNCPFYSYNLVYCMGFSVVCCLGLLLFLLFILSVLDNSPGWDMDSISAVQSFSRIA